MPKLMTWPDIEVLEELNAKTPAYMVPNFVPYAAIGEGWLSDDECDKILEKYKDVKPYKFPHCNAETRECARPLDQVLDPMSRFVRQMNEQFWQYDLTSTGAWLQTYHPSQNYQKHMDVVPGQNRKLSAVLMLTDWNKYSGGLLNLYSWPDWYTAPATRGTIIIFQPWLVHKVEHVFNGTRQTINMGFWGPNFR